MHTKTKTNTEAPQTKGGKYNNKSTTTKLSLKNGRQPKPPRGINSFYWRQVFALESVVVNTPKVLSLHGGFITEKQYNQINTL